MQDILVKLKCRSLMLYIFIKITPSDFKKQIFITKLTYVQIVIQGNLIHSITINKHLPTSSKHESKVSTLIFFTEYNHQFKNILGSNSHDKTQNATYIHTYIHKSTIQNSYLESNNNKRPPTKKFNTTKQFYCHF